MAMNDPSSENTSKESSKKPYEKPAFRYEQVFVTTALACGKIGASSMSCSNNPKVS